MKKYTWKPDLPDIRDFISLQHCWSKIKLTSLQKMKGELDKCILLCSNCHRRIGRDLDLIEGHRIRHHEILKVVSTGLEPV